MESLTNFALMEKYAKVSKLRSRLEEMNKIISWDSFLALFPERKSSVGRPNYEKILMLKVMFLQGWYGLSDEEIEFQINDRLSFQQFSGFPNFIPDYSTIWRFREELAEDNLTDKIWSELQRQIDSKNIKIEKGVIQDASFVIAEPGKTNSGMDNRGQCAKTSRNCDASWTKKGDKSYFGYKVHAKMQRGSKIVKEIAVTTARVHDGAIDLTKSDEIVYRDKGYTGIKSIWNNTSSNEWGTYKVNYCLSCVCSAVICIRSIQFIQIRFTDEDIKKQREYNRVMWFENKNLSE